jgi:hypothetical protein
MRIDNASQSRITVERHTASPEAQCFRYRYGRVQMYAGCCAALLGLAVAIDALSHAEKDDLPTIVPFMIGALVFALVIVYACLSKSDVIVDDKGISGRCFRLIWRTIPWKAVRRVRIQCFVDSFRYYPRSGLTIVYSVDQTEKAGLLFGRHGQIRFDDGIENIRGLLDIINAYVREDNIEIVDNRTMPARRVDRLN